MPSAVFTKPQQKHILFQVFTQQKKYSVWILTHWCHFGDIYFWTLFSKETGQLFTYFTEILPYDMANYNDFTLAKKVLFQISFRNFLICIQVKLISFIVVVFYSFLFLNYSLYCLTTIVSWSTGHFKWPCATFSWH